MTLVAHIHSFRARDYSSSSGYQPLSLAGKNAIRREDAGEKVEIKFFEYKDKMYIENMSLSNP